MVREALSGSTIRRKSSSQASPAQAEARAALLINALNRAQFVNTVNDSFSLAGVDTAFAGSNFVLGVGRELPGSPDTISPARTLVGLGDRDTAGDHNLLYTWRGSTPGLAPVVLVAHQDVVPVDPGTEDAWSRAPFSGAVSGGEVWGRGALDDKLGCGALLESVESLLRTGYQALLLEETFGFQGFCLLREGLEKGCWHGTSQ